MPWSGIAGAQIFSRSNGFTVGANTWLDSEARGIRADDHDVHDQDIASGLDACLKKDGGNTVSGNLRMGGFKLTNLAAGSDPTDSVRMNQLESGVLTTRGDMLYRGATTVQRLPKGTNNQVLRMGPNDPFWFTPGTSFFYNIGTSGATIPTFNNGGTWTVAMIFNPTVPTAVAQYLNRNVPSNTPLTYYNIQNLLGGTESTSWIWFVGLDTTVVGSIYSVYNFGAGATVYATSSDGRLKPRKYRRPIADSGDIIDRLRPIYFRWGTGGDEATSPEEDFGFIAQEVHEVLPGAVLKGDDGPYVPLTMGKDEDGNPHQVGGSKIWQMQHGRMEAVLVAELQSLRKRVAQLEARA